MSVVTFPSRKTTRGKQERTEDLLAEVMLLGPLERKEVLWPDVTFYDKQEQIIRSVHENVETVVPAGNELGKDFVAGFIIPDFFISRHPCKIITTSVKDKHLDVLWGEINKFIRMCKVPLEGYILDINSEQIRKIVRGKLRHDCYIKKLVASPDTLESFQGHHVTPDPGQYFDPNAPLTLFVCDEASGVPDAYYRMVLPWAKRRLIFGNTWDCSNFFYRAVKGNPETGDPGGDLPRADGKGYVRKVIHVTVHDSPNVRWAEREVTLGKQPSGRVLIPGVKTWDKYQEELQLYDEHQRIVSHEADFYEGEQVRLFPKEWLDHAELVYMGTGSGCHPELVYRDTGVCKLCGRQHLSLQLGRHPDAMGVDTAYGGDNTAWARGDDRGLLYLLSLKTPDTSVIVPQTLGYMVEDGIDPKRVMFDYGGGGKSRVDDLRRQGYNVQAVMFGEAASPPVKPRGVVSTVPQRTDQAEERRAYVNRRAELYGRLSERLNPKHAQPYALPPELLNRLRPDGKASLRRQLEPLPKRYNERGQLFLPPKDKPRDDDENKETVRKLVGCSPDESDALALLLFATERKTVRTTVQIR